MVKTCFLFKINKIWAHVIKYQTKKVVQHIIKGSILIKSLLGPFEANPKEVLLFFDKFWAQIWAPGRGRGPGGQDGQDLVKTKKMRSETTDILMGNKA